MVVALAATALSAQAECPPLDARAAELLAALVPPSGRAGAQFRGVATLQRGATRTVLQLRQAGSDGMLAEELTVLGGEHPVSRRWQWPQAAHPGQRLLAGAGGAAGCGLSAHYRIRHETGGELLGRPTERLLVQPRDHYRHGYLLQVDAEHRVLLQVVTVDVTGRVLEQFQFAELAFDAPAPAPVERARTPLEPAEPPAPEPARRRDPAALPASTEAASPAARVHALPPVANAVEQGAARAWEAAWLPPGFVATGALAEGAMQRSFTDGFSVFSVFLERPAQPMQPGEGVLREGSTVVYTRGTRLAGEPVLITVLGEVPVNTARMVADAIRPAG